MQVKIKHDLAILIGNALDHFDTSLYVFLAPVLAPVFFPMEDYLLSLIIAYATLATSIFTKPLGAIIFGIIADRKGAARILLLCLTAVGVCTLIIAFVPGYQLLGIWAPIIFIIVRIIKELFASGEVTIAKMYILDNKYGKKAARGAYFFQMSTMSGIITASFLSSIIYILEINEAWRICYFLGGSAAIAGIIMRKNNLPLNTKKITDTPKQEILNVIKLHKKQIFTIALISGFSYVTYSLPFIIINQIVPLITDFTLANMMVGNSVMLLIDFILIPIIGEVIKKYDYKKVMLTAGFVLGISIIPLWVNIENSTMYYISFVRFWLVFWGVVFACPMNLCFKDQFKNNNRYLLTAVATTLGEGVVGKLAPSICLGIFHYTNSILLTAVFICALCVITGVVALLRLTDSGSVFKARGN